MAWTHVSRLETVLVLSGGSPQGISGVSARTELASGWTPTSPFPGGAPWRWQRRHKVSNCSAVQSSPPRAWQRLHSRAQESMSECELVGGGGNRGQTGYLCLHGQAAISSLCLSHSLYQSCWDCLLRAHWEQTALSSPFSQKNEWVPFTVSSLPGAPFHSLGKFSLPPEM